MRIFCPATLLLPHSYLRPGYPSLCTPTAPFRPALEGRSSVAPGTAPLFSCRGTPAPTLGCVTRTQPYSRSKFVADKDGPDAPVVGAGLMPDQANLAQGNLNSMP